MKAEAHQSLHLRAEPTLEDVDDLCHEVAESALALTVTAQGSRCTNKVTFGLAVQVWLLASVLLTLFIYRV